jgi:6-pyruvoyltetrahydropterin/6-carboxytetrahydropterin synthase|tara:strand:- start:2081 stop:2551 length:471 start_codon:yes stop_codon:yes gene_type:complete
MEENFTSTKSFYNYPCAHRQFKHEGNCHLIHGYSRSFHFTFQAKTLSKEGFVMDYGDLKELKNHLDYMYDHTLILEDGDPHMDKFIELEKLGVCNIRTQPLGVGMEGTAHYLCQWTDNFLRKKTRGRVWVRSVEARENEKNSSIYRNPNAGFVSWL